MRRPKNSTGISPQQLKHFAVAAVAITMLLALFASGEDWGAKAQLEAVEAKNRLAEAEARKLGVRKIASGLQVKKGTASFDDSAPSGSFAMSGGSAAPSGGSPMPASSEGRARPGRPAEDVVPLPAPGETSVTVNGVPDPTKAQKSGRPPAPVSDSQRDKAKAESRARSSGNGLSS